MFGDVGNQTKMKTTEPHRRGQIEMNPNSGHERTHSLTRIRCRFKIVAGPELAVVDFETISNIISIFGLPTIISADR